jgi:aminoglycoside phosphotransferase (APT) family kinase protein
MSGTQDHAAGRRLARWLAEETALDGTLEVLGLQAPTGSGYSNETLMFDAVSRHGQRTGLVARLHPTGPTLYPPIGLDRQRRILEILQDCPTVPSPRVVGGSDDPEILGAPFFIMERLDGRVPADDPPFTVAGWVVELSPDERSRLYDNGLAVLAALHRLDAGERGLGFLAYPELGATPIEQQITYYRDYYAWAMGDRPSPTIEAGFAWLDEHRPRESEPVVLSWGDSRLGNMVFGTDLAVLAVLDWDMATLGSPELDLGWWCFFDRLHTEGIGLPRPDGFPDRDAVVARYEEVSGHEVRHLSFYEPFAAFRGAVVAHRMFTMRIEAGQIPADSDLLVTNPALQLMAALMGLPSPSPKAARYIMKN